MMCLLTSNYQIISINPHPTTEKEVDFS